MKRLLVLLALLLLMGTLLAGCGGNETEPTQTQTDERTEAEDTTTQDTEEAEGTVFTTGELAEFDGKNGKPAYVAVDGVVYDVTDAPNWPEGDHIPCNLDAMAGRDLTDEIDQAPARMRTYLEDFPVVGTLQQ